MLASDTFTKESSSKRNQISFLSGVDSRDGVQNLRARLIKKQFSLAKISIFVEGKCRSRWTAAGTDCRVLSSFTARQEIYSSAARAHFVLCRDLPSRAVTRGHRKIKLPAYLSYRAPAQERGQAWVLGFIPYGLTIT